MKDFEILKWDSEFFGVKVAKLSSEIKLDDYPGLVSGLFQEKVDLAYVNTTFELPVSKYYDAVKIDASVSLSRKLKERKNYHTSIRFFDAGNPTPEMYEMSRRIARKSRFYHDPNIPNEKVYELYEIWLQKSVKGGAVDKVIVYEENGIILGFATIKIIEAEIGIIPLMGVDSKNEGRGISFALMSAIETYLLDNNCRELRSSTQAKNKKALQVYDRFGIECKETFNLNHLWLKSEFR